MKKCPFCAGEVQEESIKCRHCGTLLIERKPVPWYFKTGCIIIAFLAVGPLALPLVWLNPQYSRKIKWAVTCLVLVLTCVFGLMFAYAVMSINRYYQLVFSEGDIDKWGQALLWD